EPVFLNALIRSFVASAGAFSSKPPTLLIYGDVVLRSAISARLLGKLVCRRQCGHSTAENGDFFRTLARSVHRGSMFHVTPNRFANGPSPTLPNVGVCAQRQRVS